MSIPYDLVQASMRARDTFFKDNPTAFGITDDAEVPIGPSMVDFASAVAAENPIDSLIERTQGATEGLAKRITRAPEFLSNIFSAFSAKAILCLFDLTESDIYKITKIFKKTWNILKLNSTSEKTKKKIFRK